jgi:hypothetical protein
MFLSAAPPRLVIDPQDSELTAVDGAETFRDPARFPLGAGVARFVPRDPEDLDAYNTVYRAAFDSFPRLVWADEAGSVLPANRQPPAARRFVVQGAKRQLGHIALHTRPREVYRGLIANAQHVFAFQLPNPDDRKHLAELCGIPPRQLDELFAALGPHDFLHWRQLERTLVVHPALEL